MVLISSKYLRTKDLGFKGHISIVDLGTCFFNHKASGISGKQNDWCTDHRRLDILGAASVNLAQDFTQ